MGPGAAGQWQCAWCRGPGALSTAAQQEKPAGVVVAVLHQGATRSSQCWPLVAEQPTVVATRGGGASY